MMKRLLLAALAALLIAAPVSAAQAPTGSCAIDGQFVTGYDLPGDELINFFITDANGKTGWVLGFTDASVNYSWTVEVPDRSGPTTYEFGSRTWGKNGAKYTVFASCTGS